MTFKYRKLPKQPEFLYSDAKCDNCNIELDFIGCALDDNEEKEEKEYPCLQFDDVLEIRLDGAYGMAIDPWPQGTGSQGLILLYCKDCTRKLCQQFPSFARIVQEHCSSTLGHYCAKKKEFVWEDVSCCDSLCPKCNAPYSYCIGYETQDDPYARRLIVCDTCSFKGPGKWKWES